MKKTEFIEEYGLEFYEKVKHIVKLFHGQKVEVIIRRDDERN